MNQRMEWKIATVMIICLVTVASFAQGQEADEAGKKLKGEVRWRYDWFGVNKDRGRFREDHWRTDQSTGGLDWLHLESTEPDEKGDSKVNVETLKMKKNRGEGFPDLEMRFQPA